MSIEGSKSANTRKMQTTSFACLLLCHPAQSTVHFMRLVHYCPLSNASPWNYDLFSESDSWVDQYRALLLVFLHPRGQAVSNKCFEWHEIDFSDASKVSRDLKQAHESFSRTKPNFPCSMPTGHHSPLYLSCNHDRSPNTSCSSLPNSPVSPPGIRAYRSFHSKSPIASMVLDSRSTFSVICLISPNAPLLGRVIGLLAIMSA